MRLATVTLILSLAFVGTAWAQTTVSLSINDGTTPPAVAPGAPAGSYKLSGIDTINLANGHVSFNIPPHEIGGRGEAGYTMSLVIDRNWRIENRGTASSASFLPLSPGIGTSLWGQYTVPSFTPGFLAPRSEVDLSADILNCKIVGGDGNQYYYGQTLTRLTFIEQDGTEHEMLDTLSGGRVGPGIGNLPPSQQTCPHVAAGVAFNRGNTFASYDGSALTFVSDTPIVDPNTTGALAQSNAVFVSGWLFFPNGVRYRIQSGQVTHIQDRHGNDVQIEPTIRDALGRATTITSAGSAQIITFPGYEAVPRTITVNYAALEDALAPGHTQQNYNVLFPTTNGFSGLFSTGVVSSLIPPDNTSYTFQYNEYAEVARVILPTGGS